MASRLVRQPISRSGAFRRVQAPRNAQFGAKRTMSSTGGAPKAKSDLPWIIGSAVVFGPALLWILAPSSRKSAPHDSGHHADAFPEAKHDNKKADDGESVPSEVKGRPAAASVETKGEDVHSSDPSSTTSSESPADEKKHSSEPATSGKPVEKKSNEEPATQEEKSGAQQDDKPKTQDTDEKDAPTDTENGPRTAVGASPAEDHNQPKLKQNAGTPSKKQPLDSK